MDSNMIFYASSFKKENIFDWINQLYSNIYIHIEVYNELLNAEMKRTVNTYIESNQWILFDPIEEETLSIVERDIYNQLLEDVTDAFSELNANRLKNGKFPKNVSNLGEIATITACMMVEARIICSNDFDIRSVVEQENYRIEIDGEEVLILQDSAEDFCVYCYQRDIASRKSIRKFYKVIHVEDPNRERKVAELDKRLNKVLKNP